MSHFREKVTDVKWEMSGFKKILTPRIKSKLLRKEAFDNKERVLKVET